MKTTRADRNGEGQNGTIRLFLADSQLMFRECLKTHMRFQADIEVVGEAGNGTDACARIRILKPDVAVIQLCMPGLNGFEAARLIKTTCPQVRILFLTLQEDSIYVDRSLKLQAHGYVLRQSPVAELLLAIRKIAGGGVHYDSSLSARLLANRPGRSAGRFGGIRESITDRDKQVLQLIAQGFSNKEIAAHLHLSIRTVEAYKVRFAQKYGLRGRVDIVRFVLQRGWLHEAFGPRFISLSDDRTAA